MRMKADANQAFLRAAGIWRMIEQNKEKQYADHLPDCTRCRLPEVSYLPCMPGQLHYRRSSATQTGTILIAVKP